jgi:hypothetical protein
MIGFSGYGWMFRSVTVAVMADTPAERMRRSRAHRAGDHSFCNPQRCEALLSGLAVALEPPPVSESGERVPRGIEAAVIAFVETLPYRSPDPRAMLAQIAVRLAQRVDDTGAMPAAVRELRVLLVQLTEVPNGAPGVVDEIRLRSAQRKLDAILAHA